MSKLLLTGLEDKDMTAKVVSGLVQAYREATQAFPAAIVVTKEQAEKFFYEAGQILSNFQGVPLEVERLADEHATIMKTINGILAGMHTSAVRDISEVYRMLENMKEKI